MTDLSAKLSAYLDGELSEAEAAEIDAALEEDAAVQKEFDDLIRGNEAAQSHFDQELNVPIQLDLIRQIKEAQLAPVEAAAVPVAPRSFSVLGALAACLVAVAIGGFAGYTYKAANTELAQRPGWIATIAEYHSIYADQKRHLVEVGADETDHIEKWLGNTVGVPFVVPDLSEYGLTFQGGRLVVANGRPVAQLMYTQADGTVVALCLQKSNKEPPPELKFKEKTINSFGFVSWSANGADYVVIGPSGLETLPNIATKASQEV